HYERTEGVLDVWQKKTKEWIPVPVTEELAKILAETPRIDEYILTGAFRQHYKGESSLSHAIRNRLVQVGIADGFYRLHGLRVTAAHIMAECGADVLYLMRLFGWAKPDMANYYVREAKKLPINRAGMAKVKWPKLPTMISRVA